MKRELSINSLRAITPLAHGIVDYALIGILLALPPVLRLPAKATRIYQIMGLNLGVYNALTDHGAAVKPLIPFRTHYKVDFFNLAAIGAMFFCKRIRADRQTFVFHAAFLAVAKLNVLLTKMPADTVPYKTA